MNIIIYICLFGLIAALFFISLFPTKQRSAIPMLFIIMISIISLILYSQSPPYIKVGTNATIIPPEADQQQVIIVDITETFDYGWTLVLGYISFFIIAVMQLGIGEDFMKK